MFRHAADAAPARIGDGHKSNALLEWVEDTSIPNSKYEIFPHGMKTGTLYDIIPAYTLQDVLDALPEKITHKHKDYLIEIWKRDGKWYIGYLFFDVEDVVYLHYEANKSLIDAAYNMLCWCIEQGYVETNKNE